MYALVYLEKPQNLNLPLRSQLKTDVTIATIKNFYPSHYSESLVIVVTKLRSRFIARLIISDCEFKF